MRVNESKHTHTNAHKLFTLEKKNLEHEMKILKKKSKNKRKNTARSGRNGIRIALLTVLILEGIWRQGSIIAVVAKLGQTMKFQLTG